MMLAPTQPDAGTDSAQSDFAILQQQFQRIESALRRHVLSTRRHWEEFAAQADAAAMADADRDALARWQFRLPDWSTRAHERTLREAARCELPARSALGLLVERFGLTPFERDALLLSLLPLANPVAGMLLGCLQDGTHRDWPEADVVLNLFAEDALDKERKRASLAAAAPLARDALLRLTADTTADMTADTTANAAARERRVQLQGSTRIYAFLCGLETGVETARALPWLRTLDAREVPDVAPEFTRQLAAYCREPVTPALMVGVHGESEAACQIALAHAGRVAGRPIFVFDAEQAGNDEARFQALFVRVLREATLHAAGLALRGFDAFWDGHVALRHWTGERLRAHRFALFSLGRRDVPLVPLEDIAQIVLTVPATTHKATTDHLLDLLRERGAHAQIDADTLVRRFRPPLDSLPQALREAEHYRQLRGAAAIGSADLHRVFRQKSQQAFGNLGQRIEPLRGFDDLVVSDELRAQLDELLIAVRYREQVLARGFDRKIAYGTGISALFHGDSGTGKTLVAEVLAGALGVDLIRVDLASVVSKYIGETEKNLSRIFDLAEADSGLLFFDEADALFGKRSETRDAHDRYANIEVSYLLQRLENYPGLVVLATNNRSHLDEAFTRRLTFIVRFSFPDATLRERMWRGIWPAGVEVEADVDFAALARRADLTGANVRNIALLACWLAASDKTARVQSRHIEIALGRELAKMGRVRLGN